MPQEVDPTNLRTANHAVLSHAGIPGVGDLTAAAHAVLNHAGIPGAGLSTRQSVLFPAGAQQNVWLPNPSLTSPADWLTAQSLFAGPLLSALGGPGNPVFGSNGYGSYAELPNTVFGSETYAADSNVAAPKSALPKIVGKFHQNAVVSGIGGNATFRFGIGASGTLFLAGAEAIWLEATYTGAGATTIKINRRIASVTSVTDTGITPTNNVPYYLVIQWTDSVTVVCSVYDASFTQLYSTTFTGGGNIPNLTTQGFRVEATQLADPSADLFAFHAALVSMAG